MNSPRVTTRNNTGRSGPHICRKVVTPLRKVARIYPPGHRFEHVQLLQPADDQINAQRGEQKAENAHQNPGVASSACTNRITPLASINAPALMWHTWISSLPATITNRSVPIAIAVEVSATRRRAGASRPSVSSRNGNRTFGGPTTALDGSCKRTRGQRCNGRRVSTRQRNGPLRESAANSREPVR